MNDINTNIPPGNKLDALSDARSFIALIAQISTIKDELGDEARHGFYLLCRQVEDILTVCLEREGNLWRKAPNAPQQVLTPAGMPE